MDKLAPTIDYGTDKKIGLWWNAGGNHRWPYGDWKDFIDKRVLPWWYEGYRRFWLHCPLGQWAKGKDENAPMTYDAALLSESVYFNTYKLGEAITPLLGDSEIVIYLGSHDMPHHPKLLEICRLWQKAIPDFRKHNVVVAFDNAAGSAGTQQCVLDEMEWYHNQDYRIAVEAMPTRRDHFDDPTKYDSYDVCFSYRFMKRQIEQGRFGNHFLHPHTVKEWGGDVRVILASHEYPGTGKLSDVYNEFWATDQVTDFGGIPYYKPYMNDSMKDQVARMGILNRAFQRQ